MKSIIKISAILLVLISSSVIFQKQVSAQEANVSFQVFYDQLSPYGQWIDYLNYGYVWIPDAGSDFAPYSTEGHWILTDFGWTWVSDYNWGWAPFHYGRWSYSNSFGWFWVPGNEWGPSWVTWRRADGYYGWEPMEPGLSISISFGQPYYRTSDHWMFVRDRDIDRSDINHYYVNRSDHERIIKNSTVINKTYIDNSRHTTYVSGPTREDVQRVVGRKVSSYTIQENEKPGQFLNNGQLRIYRPQVKKGNDGKQKPVPSRIVNVKDVKQSSQRSSTNQQRNLNPQNSYNKAQPSQPQKSTPLENRTREQKPNSVQPQNNNNKVQSPKPKNVNPKDNKGTEGRQNSVNPLNNNNKTQPSQPQKSNPPENKAQEQKPNSVQPQNHNNDVPSSQPRNVNPKDNKGTEGRQNSVDPQNDRNKVQPSQPQKSNPPENNEREQKPDKPQDNNRRE